MTISNWIGLLAKSISDQNQMIDQRSDQFCDQLVITLFRYNLIDNRQSNGGLFYQFSKLNPFYIHFNFLSDFEWQLSIRSTIVN